tara:strand:+ start:637 stop:1581 length:945 start_codon:yes stop_codon:yes gene_type:complete
MNKIVITGGLGHIGSFITSEILKIKKNLHVVIIDSLYSQRYPSLFNFKSRHNKISFYDFDIKSEKANKVFNNAKVIIHLAAMTDAASSIGKEKKYLDNNFSSTKKIVELTKKTGALLIFPSSTSVYGTMKKNDIIKESDHHKVFPQSPYAKIKIKEENLIKKKLKKKNFVILRLGTIIGPSTGMRFHTAVNKFCYQACLNKKITVWKSAFKQVRPYVTLKDVLKVFLILINISNKNINETYNVVTKNISVEEIINYIKIKKKVRISFVKNKIMNQMSYNISNKKIKNLGFKPQTSIKQQIFKTINLFNYQNLKN